MQETIKKIIKEELSGEKAKSYVQQITQFHRIQASPMFHEAAEYVRDTLLQIGLKDAKIMQFTSDGSKKYWTHISPIGWEVKSAELRLIEPEQKILAQFAEIPTSLHVHSKSTPEKGVIAELVDVGVGTKSADYKGKDVKGKFALATGRASLVHRKAVYKYGAAGVITDTLYEFKDVRESIDIPDAHSYQAIWPTGKDLEKVTFGFSISKRQGNHLRDLLKENKTVKLQAKVNAKLFPSKLDIVTATIQGSSKKEEEVFLISHLCHPRTSANDNASGSGLLLEIARTIQTLINSEKIGKPMRTIRFLWVPETYGTVALLYSNHGLMNKLVAGINLDMVGENQEICKSNLVLDRTPDSLPSYLNDFVFDLIEQTVKEFDPATVFGSGSTFRFIENAHAGGSDHTEFVDSTIKVPCVMLLQWPDLFYHSSMDTIDKVSSNSLRRVGWIAAVAILTLANANVNEAVLFANQTLQRGLSRIKKTGTEVCQSLFNVTTDSKFKKKPEELAKLLLKIIQAYEDKLKHIVWREEEAIKSVRRLTTSTDLNSFIADCLKEISTCEKQERTKVKKILSLIAKENKLEIPEKLEETANEKKAKSIVPKRLFKGTLSTADVIRKEFTEKEYEWYEEMTRKDIDFEKKVKELLNFMDGERTLNNIVKGVSAEYGEFRVEDALRFIRNIEVLKLVSV
jgi:aminopeptidase YwaD